MRFFDLFPWDTARKRAGNKLLLSGVFILSCLVISASGQQKPSAQPVARLIATNEPVKVRRERTVTAAQLTPTVSALPSAAAPTPLVASLERRAFDLINNERRAHGEEPLEWDEELSRMARLHSERMARQGFFDHTGPDGLDMAGRARACGIRQWRSLGENIAYNQGYDDPVAFAVERWNRSPKHRANYLNTGFTRSGVGVAKAADGNVFFTQVFMAR